MKALTVCQPYASLIALPATDPRHKRIENRTWVTDHRGPILIHAGKSRSYLDGDNYGFDARHLPFGAIIAVCELRACFRLRANRVVPPWVLKRWPWVEDHEHTEGPCCWLLENIRMLLPIACDGARSLWEPPPEILKHVRNQIKSAV